jgi:uncharacterized iron-regulated protein
VLPLMVFIVLLAASAYGANVVLNLNAGRLIGFERMIEELKGTRLVFVGETHENSTHHAAQLEIIKAFQKSGKPFAIGLEMFTAEKQPELDLWVSGKLDLDSFIKLYYYEWTMAWPLYRDILLYARDQRIPLIGLNVPREITHKVARDGFAALTPEERSQLPAGITCSVDAEYRAFIKRVYMKGHGGSDKTFIHFCEAQMVWNKSLERNLQKQLLRHPEQTMIVLTGSGHAMKQGIPEEVLRDTGIPAKVILPEVSDYNRNKASKSDADYLLLFDTTLLN